jgi:riboflavin kinase/FMN adenylyltransferase
MVHPEKRVPRITTLHQKLDLIAAQGIDLAVVLPVEEDVISMRPEEFAASILVCGLSAAKVIVGTNFAFGHGRMGTPKVLAALGRKMGFETVAVDPVTIGDVPVSSTAIRGFISKGQVEDACRFLGHPFVMCGRVIHGDKLGRTIGFPTANIDPAERMVVPDAGVYAVRVIVQGSEYTGVLNIGVRPTVGGEKMSIEVYIIGFSGNIYDEEISVAFHSRLRREVRFPDLEALKAEIQRDVERAVRLLG